MNYIGGGSRISKRGHTGKRGTSYSDKKWRHIPPFALQWDSPMKYMLSDSLDQKQIHGGFIHRIDPIYLPVTGNKRGWSQYHTIT